MIPPLRVLWPISADGTIVVVRRGEDWPELRRLGVARWARVLAAWRAREERARHDRRALSNVIAAALLRGGGSVLELADRLTEAIVRSGL